MWVVRRKYFVFFLNFLPHLFVNSKSCITFALAFGKQCGNAMRNEGQYRSLTSFHTDKQYNLVFYKARSVRNEKRTVNNLKIFIPASTNNF